MNIVDIGLIVFVVGLVISIGLPSIFSSNKENSLSTANHEKQPLPDIQKSNHVEDNNSKIEAIKKQIQRDIPTKTNEHSQVDTPLSIPDSENKLPTSITQQPIKVQEQQVIKVNIEHDEIKSQTASEVVDVPKGVLVKVKRVRIVEHSVNIEWSSAITGKGEIGIKQLISASIQGEIQRVKGYVVQQSESMEYEITLDGERHSQYKLVWMDVWLRGTAEIQDSNGSNTQPFQFRDRAELKVIPTSA